MADNLPALPFGSIWRENLYGIPAHEANLIRLADGTVLDCTDAADCLSWGRDGSPTEITHWTRVLPRRLSEIVDKETP